MMTKGEYRGKAGMMKIERRNRKKQTNKWKRDGESKRMLEHTKL
jgi:hypothetical protein